MADRNDQPCPAMRDALLELAAGAPAAPGLDAHLAECRGCGAHLAREVRVVAALRGLERQRAPAALDGLTVAATQAGYRQDRAAAAVRALARERAPKRLEERVAANPIGLPDTVEMRRAPAVLDRLVAEEIADPAKSNVRRWTGRLERLRAPVDLRRRIAERRIRRRRRLVPVLAAALALVLMVGALVFVEAQRGRDVGAPARGPEVVVERVDTLDRFDPLARQLLSGVSGGLTDARRIAQEEM